MGKVSVIIPVYNTEKYLAECLESCLCQTYRDAEFICVNDGTTDGSVKIIEEYALKDSRVKLINKENGGLSSARNAGLREAKGEWIIFLDSDDKLREDACEKVNAYLSADDSPDILIFWAETFPERIENLRWMKKTLQFRPKRYERFSSKVMFGERGSMPFVCRHAYKKELLDRTGVLFDESIRYGEDVIFPLSIFPQADRFLYVTDCLYAYRIGRADSLTGETFSQADSVVIKHYDAIKHAAAYWKEQGWMDEYGPDFLGWALKYTVLKVKALPAELRKKRAGQMFDEIIIPYGLDKYKSRMNIEGRALLAAFSLMK